MVALDSLCHALVKWPVDVIRTVILKGRILFFLKIRQRNDLSRSCVSVQTDNR